MDRAHELTMLLGEIAERTVAQGDLDGARVAPAETGVEAGLGEPGLEGREVGAGRPSGGRPANRQRSAIASATPARSHSIS